MSSCLGLYGRVVPITLQPIVYNFNVWLCFLLEKSPIDSPNRIMNRAERRRKLCRCVTFRGRG